MVRAQLLMIYRQSSSKKYFLGDTGIRLIVTPFRPFPLMQLLKFFFSRYSMAADVPFSTFSFFSDAYRFSIFSISLGYRTPLNRPFRK